MRKAPSALAVGEGGVWILSHGDGTVSRIDAKTNTVLATIETGVTRPEGRIAAGEGAVWITAPGRSCASIRRATA